MPGVLSCGGQQGRLDVVLDEQLLGDHVMLLHVMHGDPVC